MAVPEEQLNDTIETIRSQAQIVIASGVLGRSRFYTTLLEYLVTCAERDYAPKEIEIATFVRPRGRRESSLHWPKVGTQDTLLDRRHPVAC